MQDVLLKYGLAGACIFGLSMFVLKLMADHKKERKELVDRLTEQDKQNREITSKMFDKVIESTDKNTNILSGLKTILENRNRNGR